MGLAEIEGKLEMIAPLVSPIGSKKCIGFRYRIETISTDKEGDKSYSTIFDEIKCEPFYVADSTGKIKVIPDKIDFVYLPEDDQYSNSGKRYTQFLLNHNDRMLLIGKASKASENEPIFEYEAIKNVFAIAPSEKISHYNTFKPLLNSLTVFVGVFAFFTAIILVTPTVIINDKLVIEKPTLFNTNPFNALFNFDSDVEEEEINLSEEEIDDDFYPQNAQYPFEIQTQDSIK